MNMRGFQIFDCQVLLSALNSGKILKGDILWSGSVANSVTQQSCVSSVGPRKQRALFTNVQL